MGPIKSTKVFHTLFVNNFLNRKSINNLMLGLKMFPIFIDDQHPYFNNIFSHLRSTHFTTIFLLTKNKIFLKYRINTRVKISLFLNYLTTFLCHARFCVYNNATLTLNK